MRVSADTPFCIAVLGDFSGREQQGACESGARLARRTPLQIDRDNLAVMMQRLDVHLKGVKLSLASAPIDLHFQSIDDFHPDLLFNNLHIFTSLRDLRQRLLNSDTFHEAAQEVLAWREATATSSQAVPTTHSTSMQSDLRGTEAPTREGLLDSILEVSDKPESVVSVAAGHFNWNRIIHDIVAPYATHGSIPRQAELVSCVDNAAQALMTNLLHHSSFSALESAWRALHFLINRTETSSTLKIYLLDIARGELVEDLLSSTAISDTAIYQKLNAYAEESLDAPWGLLVGNYEFTASEEDITALERIAGVAAACGAPFLASLANKAVIASETSPDASLNLQALSDCTAWQSLREQPELAYVGLVWPRFLLRTPYGMASQPIETFNYEEIPEPEVNPQLLWGNSAFLCAVLIAESFSRSGWSMQLPDVTDIENLPTWIFNQNGETQLRSGGECLLTERELVKLRAVGAIALASIRDQDVVRMSYLQSLHQPLLAGHWAD